MEFMKNWNLSWQVLFIAMIVLSSAIFINTIFLIFWPSLKRKAITFLYSFSGGFIIPLSVKGLLGSSYEKLNDYFSKTSLFGWEINILTMIVIGSGILCGFATYFVAHHFLVKGEIHENHVDHMHAEAAINLYEIKGSRKWLAIIFVIIHRVPAGLTLGLLIYGLNNGNENQISLGLLIAFIIHVIPESLIIYYRQIDIGKKPMVAFLNALAAKFILLPFMFIGAYFASAVENQYWIFPLILAFGGTIMALASILELLPELMHENIKSNKNYLYLVAMLMIGFLFAALILVVDKH